MASRLYNWLDSRLKLKPIQKTLLDEPIPGGASWIYVFLITIRELSVALLLYSPGSQVVSVVIWELWENGRIGEVAAFSLVFTFGTVLLAALFKQLAHRYSLNE